MSALVRLQSVTEALSGALTANQVMEVVVRNALEALGAKGGLVGVIGDDGLLEVHGAGYPEALIREFRRIPLSTPAPLTEAIRTRTPLFLSDLQERQRRFPTLVPVSSTVGDGALCALPFTRGGATIGAMGISFDQPRAFEDEERAFLITIARLCGQALERAQLFEAERRARQRLELLAEASRRLSASLDYATTLQTVAELALPTLADFCFFDVREESGEVRRLSRSFDDPETAALLAQTRWVRSERTDLNLCALSSGASGFHPQVDDAWYRDVAASPEHLALLRRLAFCSLITVPLTINGEVMGALTMCNSRSGRHHTRADLALAEELGHRAALALQNARLYKHAQEAIAHRDEFLSIASHELNTPLTTLKLQLWALRGHREPHAEGPPRVEAMGRQVDRLVRLVGELLDVSRITAGRMTLNPEELDLAEVAREAIERFAPELSARQIAVRLSGEASLPLRADRLRVDQVLTNLLSNALKYGADRPVDVVLSREAGRARLSVRDRGIGISATDRDRVFERFERAVSGRNYSGFGLGLWISRQIAEAHGGAIRLESAEGEGSTFTLELPLSPPETGDRSR